MFSFYLVVATFLFNKDRLKEYIEEDEDDPMVALFRTFQTICPEDGTLDAEWIISKATEISQ